MLVAALTLRLATVDDLGQIFPMTKALNAHEDIALEDDALAASLGHLLGDPRLGAVFVIERGGAAAGYALCTYSYDLEFGGREAWLTELWIEDAHRGGGAGAAALTLLEAELVARGVHAVHLQVRPDNPAKRLYDRLGWTASPRVVMTRRLSPGCRKVAP